MTEVGRLAQVCRREVMLSFIKNIEIMHGSIYKVLKSFNSSKIRAGSLVRVVDTTSYEYHVFVYGINGGSAIIRKDNLKYIGEDEDSC